MYVGQRCIALRNKKERVVLKQGMIYTLASLQQRNGMMGLEVTCRKGNPSLFMFVG